MIATTTEQETQQSAQSVTLVEYVDSRRAELKVDSKVGILRGVKLLGNHSQNGRLYPRSTIEQAETLYDGAKVNVNHGTDPSDAPRDYRDRIGTIRNPRATATGLFADFHFNPGHPLAEQLVWDARHAPENVGFSHNVFAHTFVDDDNRTVVEAIVKVNSVDLVSDPATTSGLFEHTESSEANSIEAETISGNLLNLDAFDAATNPHREAKKTGTFPLSFGRDELAALRRENERLAEQMAQIAARNDALQTEIVVERLLRTANIPQSAMSDLFRSQLLQSDLETAQRLIEDRLSLIESIQEDAESPIARSRHEMAWPENADEEPAARRVARWRTGFS